MGLSLSQHDQETQPIEARKRVARLRAYSPDQMAAGLIWLSGYDPGTFDADWRHYRETRDALLLGSHRDAVPAIGQIELFEPGHAPVVTWRLFDEPAVRR